MNDFFLDEDAKLVLTTSIDKLVLTVRARNVLQSNHLLTLKDIIEFGFENIITLRNAGKKTCDEISRVVKPYVNALNLDESTKADSQEDNFAEFSNNSATPEVLKKLPIFSGVAMEGVTPDNLHCSYRSGESLEELVLPPRAKNVINAARLHTVGDILITSHEVLLRHRNLGRSSLAVIQKAIYEFILGEQDTVLNKIKYDSFEQMMLSWFEQCKIKKKYMLIYVTWIGVNTSKAFTLDECGKTFGLTRERIRQILRKVITQLASAPFRKLLNEFWTVVVQIVRDSGGVIALSELSQHIATQFRWPRVPAALSLARVLELNSQSGIFIEDDVVLLSQNCLACNGICQELQGLLLEKQELSSAVVATALVNYCKLFCTQEGRGAIWFSEAFMVMLLTKNTSSRGIFRLQDHVFYTDDRYILRFGSVRSAAPLILKLARKPLHFLDVSRQLRKWQHYDISERATHGALSDSNEVLRWGRGVFVHRDCVDCPPSLLQMLALWALEALKDDVPCITIYKLYKQFSNQCQQAGLPNPDALYDCLRIARGHGLVLPRFPFIYNDSGVVNHVPISILVEQWLTEQEEVVSKQELRRFICDKIGFKSFQCDQIISRLSNVLLSSQGYIHISTTGLSKGRVEDLLRYGKERVCREKHLSVLKIFTEKQVSCRLVGIADQRMLYSVFQLFASDEIDCPGYPQLVSLDSSNRPQGIIAEVREYIREKQTLCTFDELERHFVEKLGYREQTIYAVVQAEDIFRYLPSCLVHINTIHWSSSKQAELLRVMKTAFEEALRRGDACAKISWILEGMEHLLPSLSNQLNWTSTLIASIAERIPEVSVLGNARNAYVIQPNTLGIISFGDLVAHILKMSFNGAANLITFSEALRKMGIVKKHLTSSMLTEADPVKIIGQEVVSRELCHYA